MSFQTLLLPLVRRLPGHVRKKLRIIKGYRNRRSIALSYALPAVRMAKNWAMQEKELSNFYYDLAPGNRDHLMQLIATITGTPYAVVSDYMANLRTTTHLKRTWRSI
jgi:hypothetical protein